MPSNQIEGASLKIPTGSIQTLKRFFHLVKDFVKTFKKSGQKSLRAFLLILEMYFLLKIRFYCCTD